MKYKIASGTSLWELEETVSNFIKSGWMPIGGITIDDKLYYHTSSLTWPRKSIEQVRPAPRHSL